MLLGRRLSVFNPNPNGQLPARALGRPPPCLTHAKGALAHSLCLPPPQSARWRGREGWVTTGTLSRWSFPEPLLSVDKTGLLRARSAESGTPPRSLAHVFYVPQGQDARWASTRPTSAEPSTRKGGKGGAHVHNAGQHFPPTGGEAAACARR